MLLSSILNQHDEFHLVYILVYLGSLLSLTLSVFLLRSVCLGEINIPPNCLILSEPHHSRFYAAQNFGHHSSMGLSVPDLFCPQSLVLAFPWIIFSWPHNFSLNLFLNIFVRCASTLFLFCVISYVLKTKFSSLTLSGTSWSSSKSLFVSQSPNFQRELRGKTLIITHPSTPRTRP